MRKVKTNNVILDVCPDGDGIWFDAGELSKVLKNDNKNKNLRYNYSNYITFLSFLQGRF